MRDFHHKDITQDIPTEEQQQVHGHTGRARNLDAAGVLMWWQEGVPLLLYQIYSTFFEFSTNTRMPHSNWCVKKQKQKTQLGQVCF